MQNKVILGLFILFGSALCERSDWNLAISTKNQITLFNSNYKEATSVAHKFKAISAIAYDDATDRIFFSDLEHEKGSIFVIKIISDTNYRLERVVNHTLNGRINSLAYDLVNESLYWTDAANAAIYKYDLNSGTNGGELFLQLPKEHKLRSLAIDICNRRMYWSNAQRKFATIESVSLDDPARNRTVIASGGEMFDPMDIVVDHFTDRIFWVDDREGHYYSVESANLDGSNRTEDHLGISLEPLSLIVEKDFIYWTDKRNLWRLKKNTTERPVDVIKFTEIPMGILSKAAGDLVTMRNISEACRKVVVPRNESFSNDTSNSDKKPDKPTSVLCLNDGQVDSATQKCTCKAGYTGTLCETSICHNYCLHGGKCEISKLNQVSCSCKTGYGGNQCEISICHNYCLHGGKCEISKLNQPSCSCQAGYEGNQCENNVCLNYCLNDGQCVVENGERRCECSNRFEGNRCQSNKTICCEDGDDETHCDDCSAGKFGAGPLQSQPANYIGFDHQPCDRKHKVIIIASIASVTTLLLALLIVIVIRRQCRPIRPRIKKTYVLQKNVSPLNSTYRPTTEQCEITIEDCCNMTICETPCFDPKSLQEVARDDRRKDDKKHLLMNACSNGDLF